MNDRPRIHQRVGHLGVLAAILALSAGCCGVGKPAEEPPIAPGDTVVGPYYFFEYALAGAGVEIVGTQPEPDGCVEGRVSRVSDTTVWLDLGSGNDHTCPLEYAVEIPPERPWTHEVGDWVCYGKGLGRDVGEVVEVLEGEVVVVYRTVWVPPQREERITVPADNAVPLHPDVVTIFERKRVGEQLEEQAERAGTPPRPEGWSPAVGEVVLHRDHARQWLFGRVASIDERAAKVRVEHLSAYIRPLAEVYPVTPSPTPIEADEYVLILPPSLMEDPTTVPSFLPSFGQVLSRSDAGLRVRDEEGIEVVLPSTRCLPLRKED